MIANKDGFKATFRFFKVVCDLRLVNKRRADLEMWSKIREMILVRKYGFDK